jgi:hypothetical protein
MLNTLKIDKSPGPDELHPRVLKEISSSITKPLYHIFKQSLEIGKLPLDWKTALVSAIFKKGNKSLVSNYRPVSLTSVVCKIMEKLVRSRILNRMKSQNLFTKRQYGFISGRSTSLQLLEVLDKWTEALDNGHYVDCIYMDFQKAFDKVPHNRLLEKIKSYGIVGPTLNWIKDFLKNRTQKVMVNGAGSEWENVTSGIPQGSVLGPILFVIYINDLPDTVESDSYLFADDTKIFRIIKGEDDKEILQDDLAKLEEWSDKWLLKFHPEKCKHMKISKSKNEETNTYKLLGQDIETVTQEKDIGVIIDSELTFENHLCEKVKKATSIFAVMRRTFKHLDTKSFLVIYKTLVRTHLDYASSVWAPYKMKYIEKIESVQKRVTKQFPGMKNLSYPERLKKIRVTYISLQTNKRGYDLSIQNY